MDPCMTSLVLVLVFGLCHGMVLVDEDKRQGLIPFPRVGRTSFIQSPYYRPDQDDIDGAFGGPDDIFTMRYTRGLFAPRLGRRKRSLDASSSAAVDKARADGSLPRYYDADGNAIDLGDILRRTPWAILAYKDGIEKKMAFNPRLGRAMSPRLGRKRSDAGSETAADKRYAAFSPRLGRGDSSVTGDVNDDDDDVDSTVVVARRAAAFSPRLGRGGSGNAAVPNYATTIRGGRAFSPRLGRSDAVNGNDESRATDQHSE